MDKKLLDQVDFEKGNGLVPCIVQDYHTKDNLMLAYMNKESLEKTLETQKATFFSRSRNEIWVKGESHGTFLKVVDIKLDCDNDTLLMFVECDIDYNVCHLGQKTCWGDRFFSLDYLFKYIQGIKDGKIDSVYTKVLFNKGLNRIAQKVGEESTEVVIASLNQSKKDVIYESADLLYHLSVLLSYKNISLEEVINELSSRHIPKNKLK